MSPEIIQMLQSLIGLNQEAMRLHELCGSRLGTTAPCETCRSQHAAHIGDLQRFLRDQGEAQPPRGRDRPTDPGSVLDAAGALEALLDVEGRTNLAYDQALQMPLSREVEALILQHFRDERRHLQALRRSVEMLRLRQGVAA
jgi:hypothetical protein